ncbi:hypothetical protein D6T64_03490 [Cryobacterium melibiosiphilum]|uniref:Uncharacterized protein n=1 Tax=Cryobacterium melibiosiphilum TaxID=995039 RepID=A0A3A5MTR0_9MICO|nr:hypothetical protein [Cryobacterium melibiosiphilum]RJT90593.1 hypothetical protein D6T64_03490 [Cryobacterium melibiosiphilum]
MVSNVASLGFILYAVFVLAAVVLAVIVVVLVIRALRLQIRLLQLRIASYDTTTPPPIDPGTDPERAPDSGA